MHCPPGLQAACARQLGPPRPCLHGKNTQRDSAFTSSRTAALLINSLWGVAQGLVQLFIQGTTSKRSNKALNSFHLNANRLLHLFILHRAVFGV